LKSKMGVPAWVLALFLVIIVFDVAALAYVLGGNMTILPFTAPDMVRIEGGALTIGCVPGDEACAADEQPAHQVNVNSFWLDKHEVTVADYVVCVEIGRCTLPDFKMRKEWSLLRNWGNFLAFARCALANDCVDADTAADVQMARLIDWGEEEVADRPIHGVSWDDAVKYCKWKNRRLPTEAELEFALRAGREGAVHPWETGAPPPKAGNFYDDAADRDLGWPVSAITGYDDGFSGAAPVCSFPVDKLDLCDLAGNVAEWTATNYRPDAYAWWAAKTPFEHARDQVRRILAPLRGEKITPEKVAEKPAKVYRGGSFLSGPDAARISARGSAAPLERLVGLGFRCAHDAN